MIENAKQFARKTKRLLRVAELLATTNPANTYPHILERSELWRAEIRELLKELQDYSDKEYRARLDR